MNTPAGIAGKKLEIRSSKLESSFTLRHGRDARVTLQFFLAIAALFCGGCASGNDPKPPPQGHRLVAFLPGVAGDSGGYEGLKRGLREAGAEDVRVVTWGAPTPLFVLNFQDVEIHHAAEEKLARQLAAWHAESPAARIDLVGHSAGCGVILGALGQLAPGVTVDHVVLLSPSVSPGYDLAPPLLRVTGRLDVFYSNRDTLFLKWRTSTFGTYDNVKTPAAGNRGFEPKTPLPPELAAKLAQHAYDPAWAKLGDDGGHMGSAAYEFVRDVAGPLLAGGK